MYSVITRTYSQSRQNIPILDSDTASAPDILRSLAPSFPSFSDSETDRRKKREREKPEGNDVALWDKGDAPLVKCVPHTASLSHGLVKDGISMT